MFFNLEPHFIENPVEAYAHSWEYTMDYNNPTTTVSAIPFGYQQCSWNIAWPFSYTAFFAPGLAQPYCTGSYAPSKTYAFTMRAAAENNFVAMCGDVHAGPNTPMYITQTLYPDKIDWYYYDLTTTVQSRCMDWQWGGGTPSNINRDTWGAGCSTWSCFHRKYLIWWMQNIPGLGNTSHDPTGALRPDW